MLKSLNSRAAEAVDLALDVCRAVFTGVGFVAFLALAAIVFVIFMVVVAVMSPVIALFTTARWLVGRDETWIKIWERYSA